MCAPCGGQTVKGAITSKIKDAIKHKTSLAVAQLLQPLFAFCFSLLSIFSKSKISPFCMYKASGSTLIAVVWSQNVQ